MFIILLADSFLYLLFIVGFYFFGKWRLPSKRIAKDDHRYQWRSWIHIDYKITVYKPTEHRTMLNIAGSQILTPSEIFSNKVDLMLSYFLIAILHES